MAFILVLVHPHPLLASLMCSDSEEEDASAYEDTKQSFVLQVLTPYWQWHLGLNDGFGSIFLPVRLMMKLMRISWLSFWILYLLLTSHSAIQRSVGHVACRSSLSWLSSQMLPGLLTQPVEDTLVMDEIKPGLDRKRSLSRRGTLSFSVSTLSLQISISCACHFGRNRVLSSCSGSGWKGTVQ